MMCDSAKVNTSSVRQLVVTLGPASFDFAASLRDAGATTFRINASHMSPDDVVHRCATIGNELPGMRCVVDLQGKKMRIGHIHPRQLDAGMIVTLAANANTATQIDVPHPELFEQVSIGEHLSLDDGRIRIQVIARERDMIQARVEKPGLLKPRKGLNRVEHPVALTDLTETDLEIVLGCRNLCHVDFAISFAEDGTEATWIRARVPMRQVILKVERREAIANLAQLANAADAIWICRGDLGAQLGLPEMANAVANIEPSEWTTPILMAGQVLEHMRTNDTPTRSEACHVIDLIRRGYSGLVLSDETAIGNDPTTTTRLAAELMRSVTPSAR